MSGSGDRNGIPLPVIVGFGGFMLLSLWPNIGPWLRHPGQALCLFCVSLGGASYLQYHDRVGTAILGVAFLMILTRPFLPATIWLPIELITVFIAALTMFGKNPLV